MANTKYTPPPVTEPIRYYWYRSSRYLVTQCNQTTTSI